MRKALSIFSVLLFFSSLLSCKIIAKSINGERKPRIENNESLSNFIIDNDMPIEVEDVLILKNNESVENLTTFFKYPMTNYIPHPNVLLFNEKGVLIDDDALGGCVIFRPNSNEMMFYDEIFSVAPPHSANKTIQDLGNSFLNMKGAEVTITQNNDKPVAVIIWSKFKGSKWAEKVSNMINVIEDAKTEIDIYYLNVDPNLNWEYE